MVGVHVLFHGEFRRSVRGAWRAKIRLSGRGVQDGPVDRSRGSEHEAPHSMLYAEVHHHQRSVDIYIVDGHRVVHGPWDAGDCSFMEDHVYPIGDDLNGVDAADVPLQECQSRVPLMVGEVLQGSGAQVVEDADLDVPAEECVDTVTSDETRSSG